MQRKRSPVFLGPALAAVFLAACAQPVAEAAQEQPVTVEPVEGSEVSTVTLTEKSAQRLGIQTAQVQGGQAGGTVVPYSAVLYDEHGRAWVYATSKALTFLRAEIAIDRIDGDLAMLARGPEAGTVIATVGVAELFGAEMGVGDPE